MQKDGFLNILEGVYLNSEVPLFRCNWTARPNNKTESANQATKKLLLQQKSICMIENFHRMLKFNYLYNVMVNYMFPSYQGNKITLSKRYVNGVLR